MSLFQHSRKSCPHYPSFGRRGKTYLLSPFFGVGRHPLPVPRRLCGRTAPVFRVSSCVLSSNLGAHGFQSWGSHTWMIPCDGPFFSRRILAFENLTVWFDTNFPLSPQNRLSLRAIMGHNPIESSLTTKPIVLRHLSLTLFTSCPTASVCRKLHFVHTCIKIQTCDSSAREGARSDTMVLCTFTKEIFTRFSAFQCWRTLSSRAAVFVRLSSVSLCQHSWK